MNISRYFPKNILAFWYLTETKGRRWQFFFALCQIDNQATHNTFKLAPVFENIIRTKDWDQLVHKIYTNAFTVSKCCVRWGFLLQNQDPTLFSIHKSKLFFNSCFYTNRYSCILYKKKSYCNILRYWLKRLFLLLVTLNTAVSWLAQ